MPIKRGQIAKLADVKDAIKDCNPFAADPSIEIDIILPAANPDHREYLGREHRAYIRDVRTWKVLLTATSAYALVQKIRSGWKYEPNKKEGLWA